MIVYNQYQLAVAETYGDGFFWPAVQKGQDYMDLGDSLFKFIMLELSGEGGCNSIGTARSRLCMARNDINKALDAIDALEKLPG